MQSIFSSLMMPFSLPISPTFCYYLVRQDRAAAPWQGHAQLSDFLFATLMQFAFTFSSVSSSSSSAFLHSSRVFNLFYFPLCLVLMLSLRSSHLSSFFTFSLELSSVFFFRGEGGAGFVKRQFVMQFMCIQMRYIWAKLFISNSFRWGYSNSARAPVAFNHAPQSFSLVQLSYVVVNLYINIYVYCVCIQIQLSGCEISINCWPDKHYGAFINLQRLCIKCALKSFNICKVRLSMVDKA